MQTEMRVQSASSGRLPFLKRLKCFARRDPFQENRRERVGVEVASLFGGIILGFQNYHIRQEVWKERKKENELVKISQK